MERRKVVFAISFAVILITAIVHTSLHYSIFVSNNSFAGYAITNEIKNSSPDSSSISFSLIGLEWLVLITMAIFALVRRKIEIGAGEVHLNIRRTIKDASSKTDLDIFYELIKEYGTIKLSSAASIFNVGEDKIAEWSRILENANLATVNYPQVGEPEIVLRV
jgi:hypothetical protein